jgi:hypothetical protein
VGADGQDVQRHGSKLLPCGVGHHASGRNAPRVWGVLRLAQEALHPAIGRPHHQADEPQSPGPHHLP